MFNVRHKYLLILPIALITCIYFWLPQFPELSEVRSVATAVQNNEATVQKNPVILFWTTVFTKEVNYQDCADLHCHFTTNKSLFPVADAVIFHGDDVHAGDLPKRATPQQLFVFWTMECSLWSVANEGKPRFLSQPHNFYNLTMTVSRQSDVHHPYGGYWLKPEVAAEKHFAPADLKFDETTLNWNREKAVFWLVSNCKTPSKRELAVKRLSKFIPVHIAGRCAKNHAPCVGDCDKKINNYFFYIAIESTVCNDYITEKYWSRYSYMTVPIVMRRRIYEDRVPDGSFIAMDDFVSPEEMGKHLNYLMSNRTAYLEYFQWRERGWARAFNADGYRLGPCNLCEQLLKESVKPKTYEDVNDWYVKALDCEHDEFVRSWR